MKKFLGTLIFFILIAIVLWGGATWYLGQETEKRIKQQIESSNESHTSLGRVELVEYKKTSFTDATAITKITTGVPFVDDILADANIVTKIKHGPIILSDSGVEFAASKWTSSIDLDTLNDDAAAFVTELFGDKNPILADASIGFDNTATYSLKIPALSQEGEANFAIDGLTISGTQSLQNQTGPAKVIIGEMHLQDPTLEVIIPSVTADLDIQGFIDSQMLGTTKISAPNIKIKPIALGEDIRFDLDATSSQQQSNDEITGNLHLLANNIIEPSETVKNVDFDINYQGLSATGLNEYANLEAEVNNLQKQLMWNMDATKNPEGQQKMLDLIGQIQQVTQQMVKVFFDKVVIPTKAQINQAVKISGDKGESTLNAEFIYTGGKEQQNIDIDKLILGDISGLLKVIAGTVDVNIDKAMLPEQLSMMLKMAAMQNITKNEADNFSLNASMTDGKITLNGETMKFEDFIAKFSPAAAPQENDPNASLQLPADIEKRIQAEGLTDDIMQDLEESDDVDPAVLQQLKEFKHSMDSEATIPAEPPAEATEETTTENIEQQSPADGEIK